MSHACLHELERQLEPAIGAPVDAPRRVEVPQAMQAGVLRLAGRLHNAGRDLDRVKSAVDDVAPILDVAAAIAEDEIVLGGEPVLLEGIEQDWRQWDRALAGFRLRRA